MTDVKSELNTKPNGADAAPGASEQMPVDDTGADVVMVDGAMADGEGATATAAKPPRLNTAEIRKDDAAIAQLFEQGVYPYKTRMRRVAYEREKALLQVELLKAQRWIEDTGQKVVMLFEGRDAAGKGGTIKRFMEHLNPRSSRVVALNKPTWEEKGQWFFQRYIQELPTSGEMVFYDRSWYNRAGVERVMGFCTPNE